MSTRHSSPQAPQSPAPTLHLSDYLRVIHKRRWTAILAFVAVFTFGAFDTLKKTPIYQTSSQLLIEKEARRATNLSTVLEDRQDYEDDFYPTQFKILQSRALAWRAIVALGLNKPVSDKPAAPGDVQVDSRSLVDRMLGWVSASIGAPKAIPPPAADETTTQSEQISGFLGGLSVEPVRSTRLVNVIYQSPDPIFAERAANAVTTQYIRQALDARAGASKEAMTYLEDELEKQRKKVDASDAALQQYKETQHAVALDDRQNTIAAKLTEISAQVTRAITERIDAATAYKNLQSVQEDRQKLESFPQISADLTIQRLKQDLRNLTSRRAEKLTRYREKSVDIIEIDGQIAEATQKLYQEEDRIIGAVKNAFLIAQSREDSLNQQLDAAKGEILSLGRKGLEYLQLQREAASNRTLYENLLQRAKEASVTGEFKGSNIQIVDRAEVPRVPVLPKTNRDLMVSAMTGLLLAAVLVFGFEYLDNRIRTPDEIRTYLGLPFLGLVPAVPAKRAGGEHLLINQDVPSTFSEALRAVRTAVIFSSADEGARTVVVTSTAPSEGKTLVSSNLAVALAQVDQRTLLIDGDMRRPKLHDVFGIPQEPGLSNVLVGGSKLRDVIRPTAVPNLFVLPAGHIPPNPAELLGSNRYIELLAEFEQQFEWIVIDAPPVMAVTDAAVLAHRATGVIFVIGASMTSKRNAVAAVEHLAAARAKFIGAVLNRVDLQRHSYYYSPYYRKDYTQAYSKTR